MRPPRHRVTIAIFIALIAVGGLAHDAAADPREDAIFTWQKWKSIDSAVTLRPLDGPEDIEEKAEILEDRADALGKERDRLTREFQAADDALAALRARRDVLRELSDIRTGGDSRSRQLLTELTDQVRRDENLQRARHESIAALDKETNRVTTLAAQYREKAAALKKQEGGVP